MVGLADGKKVGFLDGLLDGEEVGIVGFLLGFLEGLLLGFLEGFLLGLLVGVLDGDHVENKNKAVRLSPISFGSSAILSIFPFPN